jgi:hypothetical protein
MAAEHIIPGADAKCPKCGAPCKAKVNERGGDWSWGTSDRERTTYAYVAPEALADVRAGHLLKLFEQADQDPRDARIEILETQLHSLRTALRDPIKVVADRAEDQNTRMAEWTEKGEK